LDQIKALLPLKQTVEAHPLKTGSHPYMQLCSAIGGKKKPHLSLVHYSNPTREALGMFFRCELPQGIAERMKFSYPPLFVPLCRPFDLKKREILPKHNKNVRNLEQVVQYGRSLCR
jgi:hypothetical protein